jgi:hypothetical protein
MRDARTACGQAILPSDNGAREFGIELLPMSVYSLNLT